MISQISKSQISDIKIPGVDDAKITELARAFAHAKLSVALAGPTGARGAKAKELAMAVTMLNYACGRIGETVDFSQTQRTVKDSDARANR